MEIFLILLIVLGIAVLFLGYLAFLARIYYAHVRNKGYRNPLIILIFPTVLISAFLAGVVAIYIGHHENDTGHIALYLAGPVALGTAALYGGARLLPRKARIAGASKILFPYGFVGWSLIVGGVAQLLVFGFLSHWKMQTLSNSAKVLFYMCLPVSYSCFYLARRAKARSAAEILESDPRPPVLYLRAFTYEEELFVILSAKEARKYTSYLGTTNGATLEQYFGPALRESVGPFVALGNPVDYAPPEGAARAYERDENWKERFLKLARRAACIIIQVGESPNLRWEFEALKLEGLQTKAFIFTPPDKKLSAWSRCVTQKCLVLMQRIKGAKRTAWAEFAAVMRSAGYQVHVSEPPPGSIISFDREGSAVLLATQAETPVHYVGVMLEHLQGETQVV